FLRTTAEDERVASLQPHDALPATSGADHQPMNRLLPDALAAGALAHAEALRLRKPSQRARVDKRVVENEIGLFEIGNRPLRPEVWIAGACANQRDGGVSRDSGLGFRDSMLVFVELIQNFQ